MRTQLRIVAGELRGRKLHCDVEPALRPIPDRVREALFSILGNAVPEREFFDLFAGTGVVGLEALSRGASHVHFVERDSQTSREIINHLRQFNVADRAHVHRADLYRWVERWTAPPEPVTVFLGPPFPDFAARPGALLQAVGDLQIKAAPGSVLVLQSEKIFDVALLPHAASWENRHYGRNRLSIWVRELDPGEPQASAAGVQNESGPQASATGVQNESEPGASATGVHP